MGPTSKERGEEGRGGEERGAKGRKGEPSHFFVQVYAPGFL